VAAELGGLDGDGSRMAAAIRGALDMLLDGQHTGRYRWDQLHKTENLIPNRASAGQDGAACRSASRDDGYGLPRHDRPQITHRAAVTAMTANPSSGLPAAPRTPAPSLASRLAAASRQAPASHHCGGHRR